MTRADEKRMSRRQNPSDPEGFPIRGGFVHTHPDFRRDLIALARRETCAAGEVLYQTGDSGSDLFGIVSGVVALQGRFTHPDALMVQFVWPGEWFGTVPMLARRRRSATMIARTDLEFLRVSGSDLRFLLQQRPEWNAELAHDLVYWLDLSMQGLIDMLIRDSSARCAAVLLRLAGRRWASGPEAHRPRDLPASQVELAMLCNVSRNTLNRVLQEFSDQRLVTLGYKSLTVDDPARLRAVADCE
jgi:CRP-like cAMP-binding protein